MDYLKYIQSFFSYDVSRYSLEQYQVWHRRWQVLGILSVAYLFYVFSSVPVVAPVDHLAKVVVNLNPVAGDYVESQLKRAASDPHARGVILYVQEGIYDGNSFATVEALGNYVAKLKKSKPVVAFIYGYAHANSYVLATSADYIVSQETASLGGLSATSVQYDASELMKRLGVEVVEQGFGDYKTLPKKTDPNYNKFVTHRAKILETLHKWMLDTVTRNRRLGPQQFVQIMDGQWYLGKRALGLGLCDTLGDIDTATSWLNTKLKLNKADRLIVKDYSTDPKSSDTSYPQFGMQANWLAKLFGYAEVYFQKWVQTYVHALVTNSLPRLSA